MFRKLVSNVSFSPALVGQLAFYAKRLKKEEATRRAGLIFTALALVIQSFAVFSPPEPVNASHPSDMVPGGVKDISGFLSHYDRNTNNLKDLFNQLGITRQEIAATKKSTVNSKKDNVMSWGMTSRFSTAQGEKTYVVNTGVNKTRTFYFRPLKLWDSKPYTIQNGSSYTMFVGYSAKFGWFAIDKNCGNLVTKTVPLSPSFSCNNLTYSQDPSNRFKFNFKIDASAKNGTSIYDYVINFGDSKNAELSKKNTISHTYQKAGSYAVKSSVRVNSAGHVQTVTSNNCQKVVKIDIPVEMCDVPGKTHLKKDDPGCAYTPVVRCDSLNVAPLGKRFSISTKASSNHGGKITGYVYTIKKNDQVVDTKTFKTTAEAHTFVYDQTTPGNYTISVKVESASSNSECASKFTVVEPTKCIVNPSILAEDPECQPCSEGSSLWIKDKDCKADIIKTKTATNSTQDIDATKSTAKASDRIVYKLTVQNKGAKAATVAIDEKIDDVLEYASVLDSGGGLYSKETKTLSWPAIELAPDSSQTRMFTVQLFAKIPPTGEGVTNRTSYDCRMINTFGNAVEIDVDCPAPKVVEQVVKELPTTGPTENLIFAGVLFSIVAYFYARSRQLKSEVRLIRRDLNAGNI